MAIYIEDEEISELINKYAEIKGTSKTGALRDLLKRELASIDRKRDGERRFEEVMKWLGPPSSVPPEEIPKEHYEWLSGES